MSKNKLFNLISGSSIHMAPETKVIPEAAFSVALDAVELFAETEKAAEKYRLDVTAEGETLKEQAQQEGFQEGLNQWADQLAALENEITTVHQELQKLVIPIALMAAKKVVGREIELSPDTIVDIVSANIKAVAQHRKVTIFVNKKDLDILEQNKPKIKDLFESLESFSIRERADVAPNGCVIETEKGIINAQAEHVWSILEKAFERSLTKQIGNGAKK